VPHPCTAASANAAALAAKAGLAGAPLSPPAVNVQPRSVRNTSTGLVMSGGALRVPVMLD
jgi:hypothetical protein